ncbi:Hint domain-containing protein [Paracoccus sp. Ld10]|uniref:Hint domain-containing protein n=1 Tax=Paracoccus sp. Ld10 TaxID=649158 RepID=UPI00386A2FD2
MPTTTYELYLNSDVIFNNATSTVSLASGYDGSNDIILTVEDDDNILEGDLNNNEVGNDVNQFGTATFADGSVAGGQEIPVYSEFQVTLTAPNGSIITLYAIESQGSFIGYLPSAPLEPGVTYNYVAENTIPGNSPEYDDLLGAVCFTKGTSIATEDGPCLIEDLRVGSRVETDRGIQSICWIGSRVYNSDDLIKNPKLRPICISKDSMGQGLPKRNLHVSRQHRMLISSKLSERMFGCHEALIPAIKLTDIPGIYVDEEVNEVVYFHILFENHEIIYAEGCPSESLYTGKEALKTLDDEALDEILEIFPEISQSNYKPTPAKMFIYGRKQQKFISRHLKNDQSLLNLR